MEPSHHVAGPSGGPSLPKTIEGATARYLRVYNDNFKGILKERDRLKETAHAKILSLRKKAPKFYEEKLPKLINQAASTLLSGDTNTASGVAYFHDTHRHFLKVLDELAKSQPRGEIDFQSERARIIDKDNFRKQHLQLREEISKLEAMEFDAEDLGDEDADSAYQKIFHKLDRLKAKMKDVARIVAYMEGERLEEEIEFSLTVPPNSILGRLEESYIRNLEDQIIEFLQNAGTKKKSNAVYVDRDTVDIMIAKLKIDSSRFTKEEWNELSKETLDAYRRYFRERDNDRRKEYFDDLVQNKHLRPKEGRILDNPDDLPEDVRQRLIDSEVRTKRKLDQFIEEFSKRPCVEDNKVDNLEGDDETDDDNDDEVERLQREKSYLFARIKEEPRDDYDNEAPSDDEMIVGEDAASNVALALGQNNGVKRKVEAEQKVSESDISDYEDADSNKSRESTANNVGKPNSDEPTVEVKPKKEMYDLPSYTQVASNLDQLFNSLDDDGEGSSPKSPQTLPLPARESQPSPDDDDDDDDIDEMGVVEPGDKIPCITIDDD